MIKTNTPIEVYKIKNQTIYVKREDLCSPYPGPSFSKIRGLYPFILQKINCCLSSIECIGVVDSVHSKAGWGVAWVCKELKMSCVVFYPKLKSEPENFLRKNQIMALGLGAELISIPATKSVILWYKARNIFQSKYPLGFLLPNGLKLEDTIFATSDEVKITDVSNDITDWVVSASSGTIAAGVFHGLIRRKYKGNLWVHMGYSRSEIQIRKYMLEIAGQKSSPFKIKFIDEGYTYKEKVETDCPFPCNPYYDLKAWKWLIEKSKIKVAVFWNIGA